MMRSLDHLAPGAPLCLSASPPRGGRSLCRRLPLFLQGWRKRESRDASDFPTCGGDVRQDRGGHLALTFLIGLVSATPALAACPQELAIYEDSIGQSLTFTPPPAEGQAAEHAFSIRINGQDLQGVVMWSADPERPNGIVMDHCPDGDVTGEELEACTVWQGVIYGLTKDATAPFLGKRGSPFAEALLLPDFSRSVQSHTFKNSMPSPPKADDVFRMKACQE
jgi:hypothetical protein